MPNQTKSDTTTSNLSKIIDLFENDVFKVLVIGFPVLLLNLLFQWFANKTTNQPWQVLLYILPMGILVWFLWRRVKKNLRLQMSVSMMMFLVGYLVLFTLAANTKVLDWERSLSGFDEQIPRNWLALNWAGDWRYWLVPKRPLSPNDMVVVIVPPLTTSNIAEGRFELAQIIKLASDNGAKGIVFDFYLDGDSSADAFLCNVIQSTQMPVVFGYPVYFSGDEPNRLPLPSELEACLPIDNNQGHLLGYEEQDGKIRYVPLFFRNQPNLPSISVQAARKILNIADDELWNSSDGLLQFIKPSKPFRQIDIQTLKENPAERSLLRDRLVLVGENSPQEIFDTPFGKTTGVFIHAYTIHSLRHGHYIERTPWWSVFLLIFIFCYLITVLAIYGWPTRKLLAVTILFSVCTVALAAIAISIWHVWIDVIYPVAALWLLLLLLISFKSQISRLGSQNTEMAHRK